MSSADEWADESADDETTGRADDADGALELEAGSATGSETGEPPALHYATVDEFVREFLVHVLWVDVSAHARIWCPEWWRHPAAIVRLEALHRSFEQLRLDPAQGMSVWLRDHADVHMVVLTDPNGPLKGCSVAKGHDDRRDRVIPATPAPEGLFEHDD